MLLLLLLLMAMPASYKLLFFRLCGSCCFLLLYHVHAAASSPFSFSFDFTNKSSYRQDDLKFEGDAVPQAQLVDLTCSSRVQTIFNCTGRMSYNHPVPFYDAITGKVASFSTRFNFNIRLPGPYAGDGMAFFLSSYPSMLPPNSGGGNLGLHSGDGMNAQGTNRFLAVEFDTYKNTFDTMFEHIGIDIIQLNAASQRY
uniref:Uncharacterized protein n=1 Tax=Avena sativa TaxID=4498 RepID=A0ACD5UVX9_AVESA